MSMHRPTSEICCRTKGYESYQSYQLLFSRLIAMAKNKSKKTIQAPRDEDLLLRIDGAAGIVAESHAAFIRRAGQQRSPVCWMLAGLLILVLHPGHAESKNKNTVQVSQAQKGHKTQWGSKAKGTLYSENMGDFIILQWSLNDSATEYFVYRSTSPNGPWKQTGRFSQGAARTGGAKVAREHGCQTNGSVFQGRGHRCHGTCNRAL